MTALEDYPVQIGTFAIYRGDASGRNQIRITVDNGTDPVPLTLFGTAWTAQARRSVTSAAALFDFDIDATDAATGVLVLSVPDAASAGVPARCGFDVQATGGAVDPVTVFTGFLTASGEYTKEDA